MYISSLLFVAMLLTVDFFAAIVFAYSSAWIWRHRVDNIDKGFATVIFICSILLFATGLYGLFGGIKW